MVGSGHTLGSRISMTLGIGPRFQPEVSDWFGSQGHPQPRRMGLLVLDPKARSDPSNGDQEGQMDAGQPKSK